ncbi:MAG: DUF819 family protein [Bacteroidales bacterium]|nr:DUF819 family protein [Bacteroidales bacterium]
MNIWIVISLYILAPVLIIFLFKKYQLLQKVGTVILAYAIGIVLALFGQLPVAGSADYNTLHSVQEWLMNIAVPLAIPLMLFNSDFKLWTKSLPKTMMALIGGIISIVIAVVAAFFIFRSWDIENISDVAALMTGIYTGGTMNFASVGKALNIDPNTMTLALTFEMIITFPLLIFIVSGGYKVFRKILPFADEQATRRRKHKEFSDENIFENYGGMFSSGVFPKMMLGLLLSIGCLAIGAGISMLLGTVFHWEKKLNEMIIILTITTLAIALSFNKKIRELPRTFELGMFFILVFSVVVASQFDIYSLKTEGLQIFFFILFVMLVSVTLHLLFSRFSKVSGDLFTVAHVGLLCSPPFIPPIVSAMGNRKVLISGIVIGLIGYAAGTYLGILLAWFLGLF